MRGVSTTGNCDTCRVFVRFGEAERPFVISRLGRSQDARSGPDRDDIYASVWCVEWYRCELRRAEVRTEEGRGALPYEQKGTVDGKRRRSDWTLSRHAR